MKKLYMLITILSIAMASVPAFAGIAAPADVAAIPDDAVVTESGLATKIIVEGKGTKHPKPFSRVTVHYTGWTTDGEMFDSSVERGQPSTFPLNQVINGWREGVVMMVEGEKRRMWIPADLAYGNMGNGPKGMLVFDVELIEIPEQKIKFQ